VFAISSSKVCWAPTRAYAAVQFRPRIFDEGEKARPLVGIVKIKGAVAEPRFARNILRARRVIAALDEQFARGLLDLGQALGLAPRGPGIVEGLVEHGNAHVPTFLSLGLRSQIGVIVRLSDIPRRTKGRIRAEPISPSQQRRR
jgi:hypothetical protein